MWHLHPEHVFFFFFLTFYNITFSLHTELFRHTGSDMFCVSCVFDHMSYSSCSNFALFGYSFIIWTVNHISLVQKHHNLYSLWSESRRCSFNSCVHVLIVNLDSMCAPSITWLQTLICLSMLCQTSTIFLFHCREDPTGGCAYVKDKCEILLPPGGFLSI